MPRYKSPRPAPDYHPSATWPESQEQSETYPVRSFVGGVVIVAWIVAVALVIAALMTGHWVVLPHPKAGENLTPTLSDISDSTDAELTALHSLYADCPCSRRVLNQVPARHPIDRVREETVRIGDAQSANGLALSRRYQFDLQTVPAA